MDLSTINPSWPSYKLFYNIYIYICVILRDPLSSVPQLSGGAASGPGSSSRQEFGAPNDDPNWSVPNRHPKVQ